MTDHPARSRWVLPLGVATVILVASVVPLRGDGTALPVVPLGVDTWLHLAGYAMLSGSPSRAFVLGRRRIPVAIGIAVTVAVGFGLGVELLQTAVPTRGFAPSDVAANTVGSALGGVGWWRSRRRFHPRAGRGER